MTILVAAGMGACRGAPRADLTESLLLAQTTPGYEPFKRAVVPVPIELPRDHGPHEDFQTEWWYYTGNLQTQNGRRFGYQFTIFRRGLSPGIDPREQGFATNQVYFAHLALTDVEGADHLAVERFSRGAAGLAGGIGIPFHIWLENWTVEGLNEDGSWVQLSADDERFGLDLLLEAQKPLVLHGDQGLSAKSEQAGNASYYLSYTRMQSSGTISINGETYSVSGNSWFDHEWSTSALDPEDVGWDWFGLQLSDGRDLMLYWIRRDDGSFEPASGGTLIEPDGATVPLQKDDLRITTDRTWTSPESGATYPSRWTIEIPAYDVSLEIEPILQDQELQVSFIYWEGAVNITGVIAGRMVDGVGYVELTGYSASMGGVF